VGQSDFQRAFIGPGPTIRGARLNRLRKKPEKQIPRRANFIAGAARLVGWIFQPFVPQQNFCGSRDTVSEVRLVMTKIKSSHGAAKAAPPSKDCRAEFSPQPLKVRPFKHRRSLFPQALKLAPLQDTLMGKITIHLASCRNRMQRTKNRRQSSSVSVSIALAGTIGGLGLSCEVSGFEP